MEINTTFQDFINKQDDNNQAPDWESVIKDIFESCDVEKTGSAPISRILSFIEPFLHENADALEELKNCLFEDDQNSSIIDMETFHRSIRIWIEKLSTINTKTDSEMQNVTPNMDDVEESIGYFQCHNCSPKNSTVLNLSAYSSDNHEFCISERLTLENHIQDLQHQKNQMKEELARMKLECNSCNEQNESLQGNLDKLLKKLTNEQKLNENLRVERKKDEELQEELSCANKQIVKLEKLISSLEKQNNQLKQHQDRIQSQKQGLEGKIRNVEKKCEETLVDMRILQSELDLTKQELVSQHHTNVCLVKQNQELQDIIEGHNIRIEKLKLEKETVEKLFREQAERNETLTALNNTYNSLDSSLQSNPSHMYNDPLSLDPTANDGDDEQFYYNFHMLLNTSNTTNLHDEMTKATAYNVNNSENNEREGEGQTRFEQNEMEKRLGRLQRELIQHETCTTIISKQNEEIEMVCRENFNFKDQLEKLKVSYNDLKTELGLSYDKECLLLERCGTLEDSLKRNADSFAEIQSKLNEYTNLENKFKGLNQKIEELETDNSMKYVKIVNLTVEIEKLRQILAKSEQQHKEELSKKIKQLEEERRLHEIEKDELLEKIKTLNEEKVSLQNEKEELLMKIVQIERQTRQLQCEKDELCDEQEKLQAENSDIKSKKDFIKLELARIRNENRALETEKDLLRSELINLEIAKDELENNLRSRLQNLQRKIELSQTENRALLKDISALRNEKEQLEIDIAQYKDEHSFNLQLKSQLEELSSLLEKMQEEHNSITNEYETLKMETKKGKDDNIKLAKEIVSLETKNTELLNKNSAIDVELGIFREKTDYYLKLNDELTRTKQSLICENRDLVSKVELRENSLKKMDIENKQFGVELVNLKLTLDKVKSTSEVYEKRIENLSSENRALQGTIVENKEQLLKKDLDIGNLRETCQTLENNLHLLERESETEKLNLKHALTKKEELLQQEIENLKKIRSDKDEMEKHNVELQEKLDRIRECYEEQKLTEQQLRSNIENNSKKLQDEHHKQNQLNQSIGNLENELVEERNLTRKLRDDLERAKVDNEKFKETITKLQSRIAFLEKHNEILDNEKNNFKDISEECEKKLLKFVRNKSELTERIKKLVGQNSEITQRYNSVSEELVKKTGLVDEGNKKVTSLLKDVQDAERRTLESERQRLSFVQNEIARNKEENEKLRSEINRLNHENKILAEKIYMLEEENVESKQQLEDLMMEKETWLTQKINEDKVVKNQSRTGFDRLVKKNMKLDDKIVILQQQLTIEKNNNLEKSKQIIIAKEREEVLSNEVSCITKELNKAITCNCDLRKEIEGLTDKINNLKKENEMLMKAIKENRSNPNDDDFNWENEINEIDDSGVPCKISDKIPKLYKQLEEARQKENSIMAFMDNVRDRLCERRLRLGRATLHTINVWKSTLESNFISTVLNEDSPSNHLRRPLQEPLDEEMVQMERQINVTTLLLDRLTSYKNHELLEQCMSEHSSNSQDFIEQETSPNINAEVLENLGLAGDLVRIDNFSPLELEEKFTALVLAYTIDKPSLQQRRNKQKNRLREKERALGEEISMLSIYLEQEADEVNVSSRLENILSLCTQISISAEQFGSLRQQGKLSKAVEVMINYVAHLRQNIDTLSNQCLSIKHFPVKICTGTECTSKEEEEEEEEVDVSIENEDFPRSIEVTRRLWIRENHFLITLSIAVLIAVVLFNMFEDCHTSFEFSPITPPT